MRKPCLALAFLGCFALASPGWAKDSFSYDSRTASPAPVPFQEQGLQTVEAKALKVANQQRHILEGAVFDRAGNLYFCDVTAGKVQRLAPEKELSDHVILEGMSPGGLAFAPGLAKGR